MPTNEQRHAYWVNASQYVNISLEEVMRGDKDEFVLRWLADKEAADV